MNKVLEAVIIRTVEQSSNELFDWDDVGSDGWENSVEGPDWGDIAP